MSQNAGKIVFIVNRSHEYTLEAEYTSRIPQESLLGKMMDPQQTMITKDEHGRFALTLEYPWQFGYIIDLLRTGRISEMVMLEKNSGREFLQTVDYLQLQGCFENLENYQALLIKHNIFSLVDRNSEIEDAEDLQKVSVLSVIKLDVLKVISKFTESASEEGNCHHMRLNFIFSEDFTTGIIQMVVESGYINAITQLYCNNYRLKLSPGKNEIVYLGVGVETVLNEARGDFRVTRQLKSLDRKERFGFELHITPYSRMYGTLGSIKFKL